MTINELYAANDKDHEEADKLLMELGGLDFRAWLLKMDEIRTVYNRITMRNDAYREQTE